MKKIVSIILSLILIFNLSALNNIFASEESYMILNDLGLLLNITESELSSELTRDIGVTMILKSLGYTQDDADQAAQISEFSDVEGWAEGWTALASQLNITKGIGNGLFDPKGELSEKQFVAFQLRALGYDVDDSWNQTEMLAYQAGLVEDTNALVDMLYTKKEASVIMYNALLARNVVSGKILIDELVETGVVAESKAIASGLYSDDFRVKKILANNLKNIRLVFTKAIDEESVAETTISVLKNDKTILYDSSTIDGVTSLKYGLKVIDENTIDIIFGNACMQNDIISISIDGLKSENNLAIDEYGVDIKLYDDIKPVIERVEAINSKYIKIFYSEPVQFVIGSKVFDTIFVDDLRAVGTATLNYDKSILTFNFSKSLTEGNHTISIDGTLDYANILGDDQEFDFIVTNDTEAPYIISAKAPNRNNVEITFSEDIKTTIGYITIEGKSYNISDTSKVTIDGNIVYINLDTSLSVSSISQISASYRYIEDLVDNKVSVLTDFSFKADFDNEVPSVDVRVSSDNEIVLTFSEAVQSFGDINYALVNEDEELISTAVSASGSSNTIFVITLNNPIIDSITYTLLIKGVKDISVIQNIMPDYESDVTMYDLKQPTVTGVKLVGTERVRVTYSEAMDLNKMTSGEYYLLNDISEGTNLPLNLIAGYEIEASNDKTYVDITIPGVVSTDKLTIGKVTDLSGRVLTGYNTRRTITIPNEFNSIDVTAELIDLDTIKLTAENHEFLYISPDDFGVRTASGDSLYHYVYRATIDSSDSSIAYLTLNSDIDSDAKYKNKTQYLYIIDTTDQLTQDVYGQLLDIKYTSPVVIRDSVSPTISVDLDTADQISIIFSEDVIAPTISTAINDVMLLDENGNYVTLTEGINFEFSGATDSYSLFNSIIIDGLESNKQYSLEIVARNIKDENGNVIEKYSQNIITIK